MEQEAAEEREEGEKYETIGEHAFIISKQSKLTEIAIVFYTIWHGMSAQ